MADQDTITTSAPSRAGDDYVARLHALRRDLERGVDAMLELLETLDGDPDLEDDDPGGGDVLNEPHDALDEGEAEPSLGSTHSVSQLFWSQSGQQDLEEEDEHGGDINDEPQLDRSDEEPTLGAPENRGDGDQTHWAQGDGFLDECEAGIADDDNPAVNEAARARSYQQREATVAAGKEAERQLRTLGNSRGTPTISGGAARAGISNVRVIAIGPDGMRYLVQGL